MCTLTIHGGTSPDGATNSPPWMANTSVEKIVFDTKTTTFVKTSYTNDGLFRGMRSLRTVQLHNTVVLQGAAAVNLFYEDTALTDLGDSLEHIELSDAISLQNMFYYCLGLTTLNLPKWDTSNVRSMYCMFYGCSKLTSLTLPSTWNTGKVTSMFALFAYCSALTSLTLPSTWKTSNVTDMSCMFQCCWALTSLTVPNTWDTSNVTNMTFMFYGCSKLTYLDLRHLNSRQAVAAGHILGILPLMLQELWLGPDTQLSKGSGDAPAFVSIPADHQWAEEKPVGSDKYTRVPDIAVRTSATPAGHYKCGTNNVSVTVVYRAGDTVTTTAGNNAGAPGSQQVTWGRHQPEPGKVFDGWDFSATDTGITLDPATNTISWNTDAWNPSATLTAKWRSIGTPTIDRPVVHAASATVDVTVKAPAGAKPGDTITLASTPAGGVTTSWTYTLRAGETGHTFTGVTVPQLRNSGDFNAPYHLSAHMGATSHLDTDTVLTGTDAFLDAVLPYTTLTYRAGTGAAGTAPGDANALTDTATGAAVFDTGKPDTITRPAHSVFTGWQTTAGSHRLPAGTTATAVPAAWGATDIYGHTTVTLTAQWTALNAPAITAATRDPNTNTVTLTGTAKPRGNTDTVRICQPDGTDCSDYQPWSGQTGTPFDGNTDHDWSVTLPAGTTTEQARATLTTTDTAYPAPGNTVESDPSTTEPVPSPWTSSLPLTGGTPRQALLLAAAGLLAALLLTAAATRLRNQRRKARHTLH
jgi:surface protein